MKAAVFALAAAASLTCAVSAQESITFSLTRVEVATGTTVPSAIQDGKIDPATEDLRLFISFKLNPGVGGTAKWDTGGGTGQTGTIEGLGSMLGDMKVSGPGGTFYTGLPASQFYGFKKPSSSEVPAATTAGFLYNPGTADPTTGGAVGASVSQFVISHINPADGVRITAGNWNPGPTASGVYTFTWVPTTQTVLLDVGLRDPSGDILYVNDTWQGNSATTTIEIIPAPAGLALLGLGGLAAARRRR